MRMARSTLVEHIRSTSGARVEHHSENLVVEFFSGVHGPPLFTVNRHTINGIPVGGNFRGGKSRDRPAAHPGRGVTEPRGI
jgi:hypothetical protein